MKYICNAMQEGRCDGEVGKCNHRCQHVPLNLLVRDASSFCSTEKRFCNVQGEDVHCVPVKLFPNMKNPVTVSDELAREFVEWARIYTCNTADSHICSRLAARFKEQLK